MTDPPQGPALRPGPAVQDTRAPGPPAAASRSLCQNRKGRLRNAPLDPVRAPRPDKG